MKAVVTDATIACLMRLKAYAEENGVDIDRIEASLTETETGTVVGFMAHLKPKPLKQNTVVDWYSIDRIAGDQV